MRRAAYLVSILFVIFTITSANAAVQIGVDDVNVLVGGTTNLRILTDSALGAGDYFSGFLGVPEGQAGWIEAEPPPIILPGISIYPPPAPYPVPGFSSGIWFDFIGTEPVIPGGVLIDNIIFHCSGLGNVDLTLLASTDYVEWNLYDIQTIHQIPEPASIALIGLGVLMLKRRR